VIQNTSGDGTIAPGKSVTFDFNGAPGHAWAGPTNIVLNGVAIPPPPSGTFAASMAFTLNSDWGTGFTGTITITNTGTLTIEGWSLTFNFAPTITSIWDAAIVSHSGTSYKIEDAGYNGVIAPGQSVSFGFNGAPGGLTAGPTNYVLTPDALGGDGDFAVLADASVSTSGGTDHRSTRSRPPG
jgi:cellulase/cellobiase CelA1